MKSVNTRQIRDYYEIASNVKHRKCKLCFKTVKTNGSGGVTNLLSHISRRHNIQLVSKELASLDSPTNDTALTWMEWSKFIIKKSMPFSILDDTDFKEKMNINSMSSKTFKKYMLKIRDLMQEKIAIALPTEFGLVLDGWSDSNKRHYTGLYAIYFQENETCSSLLQFSPFTDETNFSAENFREFITSTLSRYGKNTNNILFIVGDNCSTMKKLSDTLNCQFIGCHSHRLNLAVNDYIKENNLRDNVIQKVNEIMTTLKSAKLRGRLSQMTEMAPITHNVTRWSSKFTMLKRWFLIKDVVQIIQTENPSKKLSLSADETDSASILFTDMEVINSVTVEMQRNDITLRECRKLLASLIQKYPIMSEHISDSAKIIKHPIFERAIFKVQSFLPLTVEDDSCLKKFKKQQQDPSIVRNDEHFATDILQNLKKRRLFEPYGNLDWIPPTSNICERLFSLAKLTLGHLRKG